MLNCEGIKVNGILQREKLKLRIKLDIAKGEKVNIIGRNASGKSSLAYLLSGIIPNIKDGSFKGELKSNALLLLQNPSMQFFSLTVKEELRELKIAKKLGLEHLWHKNIFELSEGEKQIINLARLLNKKKALILDEPFEFLDPLERKKFSEILEEFDNTIVCFDKRKILADSKVLFLDNRFIKKVNKNKSSIEKNFGIVKTKPNNKKILEAKGIACYDEFNIEAELELFENEKVAIIGRNGSGKSLMLKALAGIEKFEGKVFAKKKCFYLPQNPFLWPLHERELIKDNLNELCINNKENLHKLSAAYRKLYCLASLPKNEILLLDEPTAWLDNIQKEKVLSYLQKCSGIIATHDAEILQICNRVFIAEKRRLRECSIKKAMEFLAA